MSLGNDNKDQVLLNPVIIKLIDVTDRTYEERQLLITDFHDTPTSIVLTGPRTRTGIRTSRSIVTVHINSTGKPTSRSSAGLSESLDAKEGDFCPLISTWELSTPLFTSGAGPLFGTPIDDTVGEAETKEAVVSAQSMVH